MSRRKDNSPAISFFSFQDIITSVTGIMFLVVLILILMLLMRRDATATPKEKEDARQIEALKAELAKVLEELADASSSSKDVENRLLELQNLKLEECPARVEAVNKELRQLEESNRIIEKESVEANVLLERLKAERPLLEKDIQKKQEALKKASETERQLEEKVSEIRSKVQTIRRSVRFTWKRSSSKTPLLVECSQFEIRVGTATDEKPLVEISRKSQAALYAAFLEWMKTYDSASYYVLLLVKPAAFPYAEELSRSLLRLGYDRGREILPDDNLEIFHRGETK